MEAPLLDPTPHSVEFYESDEHLFDSVGAYLLRGLRAGAGTVAIATPEHRAGFAARLRAGGVNVEEAVRAGRLVLLDARQTLAGLMRGGVVDAERFHEVAGELLARCGAAGDTGSTHAYGEMVDLLWRDGNTPAALRLEDLWNEIARRHRFSLCCAYHLDAFVDRQGGLDEVCARHSHVAPIDPRRTHERRLQELSDLRERTRALEAEIERRTVAEAARDEFLAMLGHELRNPLSPILTALQLLRLRSGDQGARERAVIERQVQHLVRLVDDLLDVSRITRGKLELKRRSIDLAEVVAHAIEMASPLIEQRRHRLEVELERFALRVRGDEHRLAQVVSNLLVNAAKYTPPGGRITVLGRREQGMALLRVQDDGMGIAPDLLPHVFEIFVQGHRAIDRSQGGLGLGLAICHSLVTLHGGTIDAASQGAGSGTEVTVRLPLEDSWIERDARAEPSVPVPRTDARAILVVDDNVDAAELLADALARSGHVIRVAHDGPSALELARELRPDAALLDIGLPVMDGYELGRRLREMPGLERIRLLALTGYGQASDRERALSLGFDVHMVKPVELDRIEAELEALFRRASA